MRNTFRPSRPLLALTIALAGLAGGCNDSGVNRDNPAEAPVDGNGHPRDWRSGGCDSPG